MVKWLGVDFAGGGSSVKGGAAAVLPPRKGLVSHVQNSYQLDMPESELWGRHEGLGKRHM